MCSVLFRFVSFLLSIVVAAVVDVVVVVVFYVFFFSSIQYHPVVALGDI